MASIDTSIYGNIKPIQIENPLTQYAQFSQLQQAQSQNRLADLMFSQKERGIADEKAMNQLYAGAVGDDGKIDRSKLFSGLAQGGFGSKLPGIQESFAKGDKARVDLEKVRFETAHKKLEIAGQAFGFVRNNPTLEAANSALDYLGQNGIYSSEQVAQYRQSIAANPESIKALADQAFQAVLSAKDQLPKFEMRNTGANTDTISIDPVTQKTSVINSVVNTQSPDNAATNATSSANNTATVGASMANAAAVRAAAATTAKGTVDAANVKRDQDTEMKMADDYRAQSKSFGESSSAYKQIMATLDDSTKSPAATLAAATKFMKILDPGSVVRESELGMALAASGVVDRALNYVNILQKGKVLTPTQAADFKNISTKMYQAAQQVQQTIDADYTTKAKGYKVRPEMILQDLGQGGKVVDFGSLK